MDEKLHKRAVTAWTLYDWGNSAFATTIMAAVLPIYYGSLVVAAGLGKNLGTAYWGYTTSLAALIIAILAPLLGAVADFTGSKKRLLIIFMGIGAVSTCFLFFVPPGGYLFASILFIFGNIGFSGSLVFYDSLLPHVAKSHEIDQVSTRGYAMGYLGGGLLLAINLVMIMVIPSLVKNPDISVLMTRLSFVSVGIWWFIFTIPLMRNITEPIRRVMKGEEDFTPIRASFSRLGHTFRDISHYKDLFLFLLAFWIYANGIATIIVMATVYGSEFGYSQTTLIGTLLMVQFIGIPFSFLFGWLAKKLGVKKSIYLSLVIYIFITIIGFVLNEKTEWLFWVLGGAVAMVQGGSQALSRSLISRMMPKSKSAEFMGFFSVSEKFSGIIGPAIFGVVSQLTGHSRLSILSLVIFFIIGIIILTRVNINRGIQVAETEEAELINS